MSKQLTLSTLLILAALGGTAPLKAQGSSAVSSAELDAAVAARASRDVRAVRALLASEETRRIAGRMGVSASELSTRVASLDQTALDQLAQSAQADDRILAGGANVVISTTAIIIGLLVLILLVG